MIHANFTRLSTASFATAPCPIETTAQLHAPLEPAHALSEAISLTDMVQATRIELRPLLAHHQEHQTEGDGVACTLSLPCLNGHKGTAMRPAHHAQIYAGLLTRMASDDHPTLPQ